MAITQNYVDYGAGNDTTGDGTIGTPWKTLQKAFDTLTRNATDGNQVNLKAGTAHVNAAALNLTTFISGGALSISAPLIIKGYASVANDGGVGEIDCGGATMWAVTGRYIILESLNIHTFGNNNGIVMDYYCAIKFCEIHKGASSPVAKTLVSSSANSQMFGCYIHGTGSGGGRGVQGFNSVHSSYIVTDSDFTGYGTYSCNISSSIILCTGLVQYGAYDCSLTTENIIYSTVAGTGKAINKNGPPVGDYFVNNIICGFSGVGGSGIAAFSSMSTIGYNAFYNVTSPYNVSAFVWTDLTANDVALAVDPFTDANNGDFSLTEAAQTALRSAGWPASYLGAHANTEPHVTIGAMQYGPTPAASGGGGPVIGSRIIRGLGAV